MERTRPTDSVQVNPGYVHGQIAKALTTSEQHPDPETRERARQKVARWVQVLGGLIDGSLGTGSRTPVSGVPAWATLEVVTGGFATGRLLAGGPLLEHEQKLLAELSLAEDASARRELNRYFLSDAGMSRLLTVLASGCYEVDVPEEGALLVVAWLVDRDHAAAARELLDVIAPFFSTLRFYPRVVDQPRRFGSRVFLNDVGTTLQALAKIRPNPQILAQKEAIEVWTPVYDRMVRLFLETVEGEAPRLTTGDASLGGAYAIAGGWPCQTFPEGWQERARQLLDDYAAKRRVHRFCNKPERKKENIYQLRQLLARCAGDPASLSRQDVARVRDLLARFIARHGIPGSPQWSALRGRQGEQIRGPTHQEVSKVVATRLKAYRQDSGVDDLAPLIQPVTDEEARQHALPDTAEIPESVRRKVERCLVETADELIRRGVITSSDTLARVLPQVTSGLRAAGITDPALRQLYAAIYRAFRRRRSLLLLNLESQVKIGELPWIAAIDQFRRRDLAASDLARGTLQEITALTLLSFPQAIIPNKLLQELRELAKQANLDLPLVDEVAADIFMGQFSEKFVSSAKRAGDLLAGTLYATYYDVDYSAVRQLPVARPTRSQGWFGWKAATGDAFTALCSARAGVNYAGWDPAVNGMIIEQQQILTTQNLAVLVAGLDLVPELGRHFSELARRCFVWICNRQQQRPPTWHAHLIVLKNTAYAWRQMIFYLSLVPRDEVNQFLAWADEHRARQPAEFGARFRPALEGLRRAADGQSPEAGSSARRFLGWTKQRHWLLSSSADQ